MEKPSIFEELALDRGRVDWASYLMVPTPVERHGDVWFKREDKFAPLGYGGLNGSKMRQCIYLMNRYFHEADEPVGVLSASSVKSPQVSMSTAVARHYGLESIQIIGATNPRSALKHENVGIAARLGAMFHINAVAYNPALQRAQKDAARIFPSHYRLEYGISIADDSADDDIAAFHLIGAEQARNLPECTNLIIPAGSCVTTVSILLGIARYQPAIRNVWLIGIGPSRIAWVETRLRRIQSVIGATIEQHFYRHYPGAYRRVGELANLASNRRYHLHYVDLHGQKLVDYQAEVPWSYEGIDFHPTYEGKVMKHLHTVRPDLLYDDSCFWIVGSRPSWSAMEPVLGKLPLPKELPTL